MKYNWACLISNLGMKKKCSEEQQNVFDLDRSNICSDRQQQMSVPGMILFDNCTEKEELCLMPTMEKMILERLSGIEKPRMEQLLTPISWVCHNPRRGN